MRMRVPRRGVHEWRSRLGEAGGGHLRTVSVVLVACFFALTLIVPVGSANKLVFFALGILTIVAVGPSLASGFVCTWAPITVQAIFSFGFIVSLFGRADQDLSQQFVRAPAVLFLIYLIHHYGIDVDRIARWSGVMLSVATGFFYVVLYEESSFPMSQAVIRVFLENSAGAAGRRTVLTEESFFFSLATLPFLFLPFLLFVRSLLRRPKVGDAIGLLLVSVPIVLSTSRGVILCSVAGALCLVIMSKRRAVRAIAGTIGVCVFAIALTLLAQNSAVFSTEEGGNNRKIGHAVSFVDNLSARGILIGDGLAAFYFSKGLGYETPHTEITPLDMLRYFGFVLTPILFFVLIAPSRAALRALGRDPEVVVVFLLYLVLSCTNPVLFNSSGLLVVLWYWSKVLPPFRRRAPKRQRLCRTAVGLGPRLPLLDAPGAGAQQTKSCNPLISKRVQGLVSSDCTLIRVHQTWISRVSC
jgi:hypothetical protein